MTVHSLIRDLESRSSVIASLGLTGDVVDEPLSEEVLNCSTNDEDLKRVARAIEALVNKAGVTGSHAKDTLKLLIQARHFYGAFSELGAYSWLDRNNITFTAQVPLRGHEVLNPNGCTIDGSFTAWTGYFDVKAMGFQEYVAEQFRTALQSKLSGLQVSIEGSMSVSVKAIEGIAFKRLGTLVNALKSSGIGKIAELDWTIRAETPKNVTSTAHSHNPYQLAEENRYYPFKTAGQFTRAAPFLQIFPYAAKFSPMLFVNFSGSTETTLRSLARRVFLQLTVDASPATPLDDKVAQGVTIADAAKLISALLFINLDNDESWLFLNPRATHKITDHHIDQLFDFNPPQGLSIDDFAFDNY